MTARMEGENGRVIAKHFMSLIVPSNLKSFSMTSLMDEPFLGKARIDQNDSAVGRLIMKIICCSHHEL